MSESFATAVAQRDPRVAKRPVSNRPAPSISPPDFRGVVHLTAEYWPLARTGGLGEAVSGLAGLQADDYSPNAFERATGRATDLCNQSVAWQRMMRVAMTGDFGWRRSRARYAKTYRQALAHRIAGDKHSNTAAGLSESAP